MTVARSTGAFLGTDESSGVSVAAGETKTGNEVDVLGGTDSFGDVHLYVVATTTGNAKFSVALNRRRATGSAYSQTPREKLTVDLAGAATHKVYLGLFPASRYMNVVLVNETAPYSGAMTNVAVLYELEKVS